MSTVPCRCGHTGDDAAHPCHGKGYTCRRPARQRFYNARLVPLAGHQMKCEASDTWSCDACWVGFRALLDRAPIER